MKNKPQRHKEHNTFKFVPFSERISNINVDVFHRVGHRYEDDTEEKETTFFLVYERWTHLNKSESFKALKAKLLPETVQTLPQILVQKQLIVNLLLEQLVLADDLSLQASLELVVALAQDLAQEFYEFYPQFHTKLIALLNTKNANRLEWTFTCLAYLFKFLWRYIVKDLSAVFESLIPLLSSSKPQYVNNFAADCFAFIARKVKDRRNFLKLILRSLQKTRDGVSGCGRLLLATVSGVCGQFHSCAEPLLSFLLQALSDETLPRRLLFEVLDAMVGHMCSTISSKQCELFWKISTTTAKQFAKSITENCNEKTEEGLCFVLQLMQKALAWHDASWLMDPPALLSCLVDLMESKSDKVLLQIVETASILLLSPNVLLTQERTSHFINKILSITQWDVVKSFLEKTIKFPGFDLLLLPKLIDFCGKAHPSRTLDMLTKLILYKSPPMYHGSTLDPKLNCSRYVLNFQLSKEDVTFSSALLNEIPVENAESLISSMEKVICALIVLPHLEPIDGGAVIEKLQALIQIINGILVKNDSNNNSCNLSQLLFVLLSTLKCFTIVKENTKVQNAKIPESVSKAMIPFIGMHPYHSLALRCLSLCLDDAEESFCAEISTEIWDVLVLGLSSAYHQVRIQSARLLMYLIRNGGDEEDETRRCLSVIVEAETIPSTVHEYREKLKILQQIECCQAIVESKFPTLPLNYLLGILYVNFKLLWEPVCKLISSYAIQLPRADFWSVYNARLLVSKDDVNNRRDLTTLNTVFEITQLTNFFNKINALDEKPDHWNYRNLIWKNMCNFVTLCEQKNRDVVALFLSFLEEEYFRANSDVASKWNIKLTSRDDKEEEEAMEISNEEENEDDVNEGDESNLEDSKTISPEPNNTSIPGKSATKALLAHMLIFSKLKDPKSMFREPEMKKAYFELLTHKNPEVQKCALDCVMTYKHKFIVPYRDHLYGLIDDKSFKDEITLFRIDTESEMVRPEHRPDLMPIVMRILYSKMLNKSGVRTGSKSLGQLRRSLVLRFLAGCNTDELMMYLQMAFRLYVPYIKDSPEETVRHVQAELDLGAMVPPRRLQSSINLLSVVLTQCGGLMADSVLSYLMKVLLCIGQMASTALQARETLHPGYIAPLRSIRNSAIDVLSRYFDSFENYPWTSTELDTVFEVFVWPWLCKLPIEGVHSPTSLFKLFSVWSKNQRYFPLLGKRCAAEPADALTAIMSLLIGAKTHNSVCNGALDIVERLLTLQDLKEEKGDGMDVVEDSVPIKSLETTNLPVFTPETVANYSELKDLNYGSFLLLSHIPTILEKFKLKLAKKGLKCNLGQRDLAILSRTTELVKDSATSKTLISLLLPLSLKKAKSSEEVIYPLLSTVSNLIKNVENPACYVQQFAPMFGLVSSPEARKKLTQITASISREGSEVDEKLLDDLNAWDKRWLDQPDFNRRLDAFKRIQTLIDDKEMPVDMGIIIIHTCFHFLRTEKDMSLRDNSSLCIRTLCPALCLMHKNSRDLLVEQTILKTIASAIRDKKNDLIQHEATALLGCMVRECSDLHPVLKDLHLLSNKADLEVDFFENLLHLQLHRRVRALLKLSELLKRVKKLPLTRTITQFLLPMITQFLCTEKYSNKNSLVDAAIEALGTVCKLLPWHQYELILRYFLGKMRRNMDFQKQLVRIVVTVLNSFHFDLSKADDIKEKAGIKEDVMEVDKGGDNEGNEGAEDEKKEYIKSPEERGDDDDDGDGENEEVDETEKEEKELEENLNKEEEPVEENLEETEEEKCMVDKVLVLSRAGANRVIQTIRHGLLLQLHKAIAMRTQSDVVHKLNRKQLGPDRDEEDILRIPIALAAVKLLQRLPQEFLDRNLSGILMKLCTFLKSRLDSVRRTARETMQKVMIALGPKYMSVLIAEMTQLLTRGFHVHVLVYSLHCVLVSIKEFLEPGDIDACLPRILEVCKLDLFGNASEEKEVAQIAGKLMEARANKSYDMFHIMGEYVTEKCLLNIVLPLKEELSNTLSHKVVHKVSECLRQLVLGLVDNQFLSVESMLIFSYGVTSESIPALAPPISVPEDESRKQKELAARQKPDTFLIPEDPKVRPKFETKHCAKTNSHVLVEFGLRLVHFILKRDKAKGSDFRPLLDPLVTVLQSCLTSQHVKITSISLQCFCWILTKELPALQTGIKKITEILFGILHKYAAAGLSKGDNFDLVMVAFKAVAVIVRDVKYYQLTDDQLQALLLYCEQDIHDHSRQATAFTLLKAILGRKLNCPELHEVVTKVAELSITSHLDHIRLQARQIVLQFVTHYNLGKKFLKHLHFYVTHLDYDLKPGRESALEMLHSLINTLPEILLKKHNGLLFVTIAARLVNDDAPECRKKVAELIVSLLTRVDKSNVNSLFDIVLLWMQDKKVALRRLGAQVCGLFVSIEQESFERRLPATLKVILQQFDGDRSNAPGKFVRLKPIQEVEDDAESEVSNMKDHHLYQLLHMLVKIASSCPKFLKSPSYTEDVECISDNAQKLLSHPHEWVRFGAAQFLSRVIGTLVPAEVAEVANGTKPETTGYLMNDTRARLKSLALDHCNQLTPGVELEEKFLMQCMKNLVFVAEVLKDVQKSEDEELLTLPWLIRHMRRLINMEISQTPSSSVVRTMVFHWMAAIALKLDADSIKPIVHHMMAPLVREMNLADEGNQSKLKQIAKEASGYVRRKVGSEEYTRLVMDHTKRLDVRRAERKMERAQMAVREPELAAKRKIMKQQKKKELKKRKIEKMKTHKTKRKPKKKDIDLEGIC